MKGKIFRPNISDPTMRYRERTKKLAYKVGFRLDRLQTKIYEAGLTLYEKGMVDTLTLAPPVKNKAQDSES